MDWIQFLTLTGIGIFAGILSGIFGVGGGIIIVPALVYFLDMSQKGAQGTSLGLMLLPIGILAATDYYKNGNMNISYALIIAAFFVLGGFFGSKIAHSIDDILLKRSFALIMAVVALKMFLSTYAAKP